MKKSIPFEIFGANQYIYFDIKRLMKLEQLLGKSISNIVATHDVTLNFIVNSLMVGMSQHYKETAPQWTERVEKFFDGGGSIEELGVPIIRAVIASGIFGKIEAEAKEDEDEEKNVDVSAELTE